LLDAKGPGYATFVRKWPVSDHGLVVRVVWSSRLGDKFKLQVGLRFNGILPRMRSGSGSKSIAAGRISGIEIIHTHDSMISLLLARIGRSEKRVVLNALLGWQSFWMVSQSNRRCGLGF